MTLIDGNLSAWEDLPKEDWESILLGNGFSINISPDFRYESLYSQATDPSAENGLGEADRKIFETFSTTNFEAVLAKLRDATELAECLGQDPAPYRERFQSVQASLGSTVRRVHLEPNEMTETAFTRIRDGLSEYRVVFSTSYDLILYWAMAFGDQFEPFCDCFWTGVKNQFDSGRSSVFPNSIPVYYLHGALHLVVEGSGKTRKLTRDNGALLSQFGKPLQDEDARPLIISEASPRDKLAAIESNEYLAHCYQKLKDCEGPIVILGNSLSGQDQHLVDAINSKRGRAVAVSLLATSREKIREEQSAVRGKLHAQNLYFFDAGTHPLGSAELCSTRRIRSEKLGRQFRVDQV